jgi:nucleoside-diphosphate-sugar epimerase
MRITVTGGTSFIGSYVVRRVTSTVFGVTRPDRYDEILALAGLQIPDELWPQIDQAVTAPQYWLD